MEPTNTELEADRVLIDFGGIVVSSSSRQEEARASSLLALELVHATHVGLNRCADALVESRHLLDPASRVWRWARLPCRAIGFGKDVI